MENEEQLDQTIDQANQPAVEQPVENMENKENKESAAIEESVAVEQTAPVAEEPVRKARPQIEITQDMVDQASKMLTVMLDYLALEGTVKAEKRPSKINLLVASEDAGRIIGRKGQSLESLQLLLNRMLQNGNAEFPKVYIDIDGYSSKNATAPDGKARERRGGRRERPERGDRDRFDRGDRPERGDRFDRGDRGGDRRGSFRGDDGDKDEILRQQALDAAKEVRRWGEPKELPPMNSHDRRIIHITLETETDLATDSVGDGSMKSVVVSIKK